jgi:glycosyltransferase 2 family protein
MASRSTSRRPPSEVTLSPVAVTQRSHSSWSLWSRVLLGVVVLLGSYVIVRNYHDLGSAIREIGWGTMLASWCFALAGSIAMLGLWLALLRALGARVSARQGWRVFFVSALGKYLPGLPWATFAQMEAGQRWGVRRRIMLMTNILMLTVLTGSGLAVGLLLVSLSVGPAVIPRWALMAAAALVAVSLWPRFISALLDWATVLIRREPMKMVVETRGMFVAFCWALLVWALLGMHVWLLSRAVGASGATALAAAVGGMALAWALGLVAVFSPDGVGVRDGVILAVLAPVVGRTPALAIALASRVMLVFADVVLAGVAAIGLRWRDELTPGSD